MKGVAYGVGVGPGDPELMTVKAIRLIRETRIVAVPGAYPKDKTHPLDIVLEREYRVPLDALAVWLDRNRD